MLRCRRMAGSGDLRSEPALVYQLASRVRTLADITRDSHRQSSRLFGTSESCQSAGRSRKSPHDCVQRIARRRGEFGVSEVGHGGGHRGRGPDGPRDKMPSDGVFSARCFAADD